MNYYYLSAAFIVAGGLFYIMELALKRKEASAKRKAELMLSSARAKFEAKRAKEESQIKAEVDAAAKKLENTGQVFYSEDYNCILIRGAVKAQKLNREGALIDIKSEIITDDVLASLGYEYIGDL